MALTEDSIIMIDEINDAVTSFTVSGNKVTFTRLDGTTGDFTTQDTTYSNMTAATASAAGKAGLVPAPSVGANTKFLRGDATWQLITGTLPAGSVIAFAGNPSSAPSGFLPCDGSKVSRTTYAELFKAIGTIYGEGDGSSNFNLPNMTGRFIQGYDSNNPVGTVKLAGLPEIAGNVAFRDMILANGCFSAVAVDNQNSAWTGFLQQYEANFSANRYNSIYGNSSTVQPPALTMRFYIKY